VHFVLELKIVIDHDYNARRQTLLGFRKGQESPETIELLRLSGVPVEGAFRRVYGYGKDRWAFLQEAGYPIGEVVRFMRGGYWSPDIHEIWDFALPEHIQTAWGKLFWAGYSIEELRSVGFTGEVSSDQLQRLQEERGMLQISRKVFWGYGFHPTR